MSFLFRFFSFHLSALSSLSHISHNPTTDAGGCFSSYYGGGVGGPSPKTASLPAIDRDGFDHDAYVTESVRDVPLAELQARCVSMAGEIKQLDGDMQMLVYENYSKFIVATDTVKHMRTNVDTIEGRVEELTTSVDATAAKAGERFDNGADNIAVIIDNLMATRRRFLPESHPDYEVKK